MGCGTVLVAGGDAATRATVNEALARAGFSARGTGKAATLWDWIRQGEGDVIIAGAIVPGENTFDLISRIKQIRPELPIIVMSAQNTFMTALRAAERGAYDYFPKPFDIKRLVSVVGGALRKPELANPSMNADAGSDTHSLVGRSTPMQEVYRVVTRLTHTDLRVLITGESGTGKELVARALHDYGQRRKGPFIAINMAALPRELIESELFGHEKGAFTGAAARSAGRFQQADGGTLFLDEIGDMPMEAQTRLLRVLQEGEFTAVGGRVPIKTDVRIVAATNKSLENQISRGLFREDLYYRLNVVPLRMPPLRERLEDVPDLVRHFLKLAGKSGLPSKSLTQDAFDRLKRHGWPGNVRELENLVRRLSALYPHEIISADIVDRELATQPEGSPETFPGDTVKLNEWMKAYLSGYFGTFGGQLPPPGLYDRIMRNVEVPLVAAALSATHGNQVKAAQLLGLNRNTLRKKIRGQKTTSVSPS
ncbi:MAG: nitrogen regulation protein NR(I) [Rhodomicrobium sp.]